MTPPPTHSTPPPLVRRPRLPDKGRVHDVYAALAPILAVITLLAAFSAVGWSWQNSRADHQRDIAIHAGDRERIADNAANSVTNCTNANESREASRALWNFVLDLLAANNPDPAPAQVAFLDRFRVYVGEVYQPHDCANLAKKYPLPPAPSIPAGTS